MKDSNDCYALDANVVLRYVMHDDPTLYVAAEGIFLAIDEGTLPAFLDPVNLGEVVWVMKSFYRIAPSDIGPALARLLAMKGLHVPDKDRYINALALYAESVPDFGDACACAQALEQCEGRLLSFDRDLDRVPGIARYEEPTA